MASESTADPAPARSRSRAVAARAEDRGVERPLADSELFFSTTDAKGVITSGNRVFERVSGYAFEEMVGRAHNIVRHPDMPRAVFQLLWDTIATGEPIAAYVRNRTADGAFYWVLATVVPIRGGYLSVRLAPGSEQFEQAKGVYAELVALEREIEGDDVRRRKESIAASTARLKERLSDAGYPDYTAFMHAALPAEVAGRAERLSAGHRDALATAPLGAHPAIANILCGYGAFSAFLAELVSDLARYSAVGTALAEQSSYLRLMGDDVRLFALNAQIGASRLGEHGAALDAVARLLTQQSQATSPMVAVVAERAAEAVGKIDAMTFQLSLSTIQAEMIAVFAHESADDAEMSHDAARNMLALTDALQGGSEGTFSALHDTARSLEDVLEHVGHIATGVSRLARLALTGRVELASVPDAGSIGSLFSDVEEQVIDARARLGEFATIQQAATDLRAAAEHKAMHIAAQLRADAGALAA